LLCYSPPWLFRFVFLGGARFNTDDGARALLRPIDGVTGQAVPAEESRP
jgi:hypothetical protein